MASTFQEEKSKRKLEVLRRKEEEESTQLLAQKYKLPYVDLSLYPIDIDAVKIIPEEKARNGELVIFNSAGKRLRVAIHNPENDLTKAMLKHLEEDRYILELYLASKHSLAHVWEFYKKAPEAHAVTYGAIQIAEGRLAELVQEIRALADVKKRVEETFLSRTTEALEVIMAGAIAVDASDIHIEPHEEGIRLRFRIDGTLYDVIDLPHKLYALLLSRIKLISELKLNVHDRAQDGRFTVKMARPSGPPSRPEGLGTGGADTEVRTSVLPGPSGENVVLRVLNPQAIQVPLEELGMQPWVIDTMLEELKKPNGMIVTTGPTGSGKTTTLYAFLRKIYVPAVKIITIEDPIEYHLSGIEQTQVDSEKGYDFANGLRSIVRQDPDVILVGEIRDFETAETAMHAALTGHLVFSTLHTNNAAGTIPRLLDLGVKPAIIAPAINIAMAQRLARKLCPHCKKTVKSDRALEEKIHKEIRALPKGVPTPPQSSWKLFKASAGGCDQCNLLSYKGRIGVFEIIQMDDSVEGLITRGPSESELKKEQERQGQINMRQDGVLKVIAGITDFAELERVVGS